MATTLTRAEATAMLTALGFDNARRAFVTAAEGFQTGWNLGPALDDDGAVGDLTSDALRLSYARLRAGKPTMSAHFSYAEFRCSCGGRFRDCRRIWVLRTHVRRLEAYRASVRGEVRIVSGCRCPGRNRAVGGASSSQHMFGAASDVEALVKVADRRKKMIFAGLGFRTSTTKVVHVDSRDVSGHNASGGTQRTPTEWRYAT